MTALDDVVARFVADTSAFDRPVDTAARKATEFGRSTERASLVARKAMLSAAEAADRVARAERDAADAAKQLERGELSAAEAARVAARASREVERAAIAEREAQLAAARAAKEKAQEERKAAITAAAEHLAALRSVGAVKEHNTALAKLRNEYRDFDKAAGTTFKDMERLGGRAFGLVRKAGTSAFDGVSSAASGLAESGPMAIGLTVGALGAVPIAALAAEGAITLGVGGALAGLGLYATKGDKEVRAALGGLKSHVKSELPQIAAPFKQTWLEIAAAGRDAFDGLEPTLQADFAKLAPAISNFAHEGAAAIDAFAPALDAATNGADALLAALGPRLPGIASSLSRSITIMANSAADNADAFASLAANTAKLLPPLAAFLDYSVRLGSAASPIFDTLTHGADTIRTLGDGLSWATGGLISFGHGLATGGGNFAPFAGSAGVATAATRQFKTAEDLASLSAKKLTDALDKLAGGNLAEDEAVTAAAQALKAASKAADHHRKVSLAEKSALESVASADLNVIERMKANHESATALSSKMASLRSSFIRVAEKMGYTAEAARKLATRYGLLPARKDTHISSNADQQRREVKALERQIAALHGKRITITTIERTFHYTTNQLINKTSGPGYAHGGLVQQRLADGGPSGLVRGPGTGTSDSIVTALSNGEYVVNAKQTHKHLALLEAINKGVDGFAHGGRIGIGKWEQRQIAARHAADARLRYARARPEELAALAAQSALTAMRRSVLGGIAGGPLGAGPGSGPGTVVQYAPTVHVTVQGNVTTERQLINAVQQGILLGRKQLTLPSGR